MFKGDKVKRERERETSVPQVMFQIIPVALSVPISNKGD